jgi:phage/plasmid-associated DNA primase
MNTNNTIALTPYTSRVQKLIETLKSKYPNNLPIPCKTKTATNKNVAPLFRHADGKYTWEFIEEPKNEVFFREKTNIGILLKDLIVIDIDDKDYIPIFERKFNILTEVVSEVTNKGKHYYFKRTPLCDELGIFTAVKPLQIEGNIVDLDIKTIHSNGTASIIICDPSPKKEWIKSIYENELIDIPENIINYLKSHWRETAKKAKKLTKDEKKSIIDNYFIENENVDFNNQVDYELIKNLIEIIKPEMNSNYEDWMKVGWALYNVTNGNMKGFEIFDFFSQDNEKYLRDNCFNIWSSMQVKKNGYTEGSLRFWAKKIDMKKYNEVLKKNIKNYLQVSLRNTDYDIANVIYQYYKEEFIIFKTKSGKMDQCWRFCNHRWMPKQLDALKNLVMTEIHALYMDISGEYLKMAENTNNEDEKNRLILFSEMFITIGKSLLQTNSLRNIFDILSTLFIGNYEEFNSKLNDNGMLIGFDNGVYDLQNQEFRDGKPEDYITFTTGYDYNEEDDIETQSFIKNMLWESWENDDIYKTFMDLTTYSICGNKSLEIYAILYGRDGRNGKGLGSLLKQLSFGNYFKEIKANNFTDPKDQKGGTDSEMAQLQGIRLVESSEPDKNAKFQLNRIKEWTGGGDIKARQLHEEAKSFRCQFIAFIQANHQVIFSCYKDKANEKRLKVFPYPFTYVDEPKKDYEKKIDTTLKHLLKNDVKYRQQFMKMLLNNFSNIYNYKTNAFHIKYPKAIVDATNHLLNQNNEFMLWLEDNYIITHNQKDTVKKTEMYNLFKIDNQNVKKTAFYKYMEENGFLLFKLNGYEVYRGLKEKEEKEDEENKYDRFMFKSEV